MSIRSLIVATAIIAAGTGAAFAQSSPSPANQSGGSLNATTQSPTDQGAVGVSGNTKATPSGGASAQGNMKGSSHVGTTGAGDPRSESQMKNASPGSQNDTIDKVK